MIDFDPTRRAGARRRDRAPVRGERDPPARARGRRVGQAAATTLLDAAHELGLVANALPGRARRRRRAQRGDRRAVAEELAWGDLAIALAILSPALVAFPVADYGSDAQQQQPPPALRARRLRAGRARAGRAALRRRRLPPAHARRGATATASCSTARSAWCRGSTGGDAVLVSAAERRRARSSSWCRATRRASTTSARARTWASRRCRRWSCALAGVRVPADGAARRRGRRRPARA